jgi:electron transport complex protein RnfG
MISLPATLGAVCAVAALALAFTYGITRERIEAQIREQTERAARMVFSSTVNGQTEVIELPELLSGIRQHHASVERVFSVSQQGTLLGHAVQVRSRGYGGPVILMIGIRPDGAVSEVAVVEHRETPGLGSYIDDSKWREQFRGKTPDDPMTANKDISTLSGATISGKAVIRGVRDALAAGSLLGGAGK